MVPIGGSNHRTHLAVDVFVLDLRSAFALEIANNIDEFGLFCVAHGMVLRIGSGRFRRQCPQVYSPSSRSACRCASKPCKGYAYVEGLDFVVMAARLDIDVAQVQTAGCRLRAELAQAGRPLMHGGGC
jgi:hypothetical protein